MWQTADVTGSWWYGHLWWFYCFLHFDISEIIAFARYRPVTPAWPITSETVQLSIQYSIPNKISHCSAASPHPHPYHTIITWLMCPSAVGAQLSSIKKCSSVFQCRWAGQCLAAACPSLPDFSRLLFIWLFSQFQKLNVYNICLYLAVPHVRLYKVP